MADLTVAQTILDQLGGRRFTAMTGAKDFVGSEAEKSLTFRLPSNFANKGINRVKITLDWSDTYTVEAMKITKGRAGYITKAIEQRARVYAEDLQKVFTEMTGLDTHL
ncbi:hypothetical protein [Geomonas subterranea]|uniref:hypothetical protein n=1 Tax=Geomonas subterranea TaxID=2847989 RepID=UPI001CD2FA49|nr:hypothetical protein [Geomonas fuzhouensis]